MSSQPAPSPLAHPEPRHTRAESTTPPAPRQLRSRSDWDSLSSRLLPAPSPSTDPHPRRQQKCPERLTSSWRNGVWCADRSLRGFSHPPPQPSTPVAQPLLAVQIYHPRLHYSRFGENSPTYPAPAPPLEPARFERRLWNLIASSLGGTIS